MPKFFPIALVCLCLLFLAGCVEKSTDGADTIYNYEMSLPALVFLGGLVAVPIGWKIRGTRFGWVFLVGGPIAALGIAPSLFLTKVTVNDEGFRVANGIWGATATHEIDYSSVRSVRLTAEESRGRRGRKSTSYYLIFSTSAGEQKVSVNNDVVEEAAVDILSRLAQRGVLLQDLTNGR